MIGFCIFLGTVLGMVAAIIIFILGMVAGWAFKESEVKKNEKASEDSGEATSK